MPIGNNIGEKVKSLSYAKIVQMSAEHQARLSVMPSAALFYAKIVFFLFLSSLAKKGTERRQRKALKAKNAACFAKAF
jgi:hypothetical protein